VSDTLGSRVCTPRTCWQVGNHTGAHRFISSLLPEKTNLCRQFVCVHACMYMHRKCTHTCIYIHACTHVCRKCTHMHEHTCRGLHTHARTHVHIHTCTEMHTHAYTHACTHNALHTCSCNGLASRMHADTCTHHAHRHWHTAHICIHLQCTQVHTCMHT
jgi:hypothetical protein